MSIAVEEGLYNPILDDLKVVALHLRSVTMEEANMDVDVSQAEMNTYQHDRNKYFNEDTVGLVDVTRPE